MDESDVDVNADEGLQARLTERIGAVADKPDSLEYLKSGRVRMMIDGRTYTLRAPRVGAYSELMGFWQDDVVAGDESRSLNDRVLDWWEKTFKILGDKPLPEDRSDLPTWLVNGQLPSELFTHWREVPLSPS